MGLFKDITRASNYVAATTTEGIALVQAKTPWIGAAIAKATFRGRQRGGLSNHDAAT
jgi:hypothetical protein